MTGASLGSSASSCSEWFNNTATTVEHNINYEFIPRMEHPKLKGCSLFFVFEYHGPLPIVDSSVSAQPPPFIPFACIFKRDFGVPTEPLFLWAPRVPGVGPIEFWAFIPATWFLEYLHWPTCSNCIGASVVPLRKLNHVGWDDYYFPSKETKTEIPLEELEDSPLVDVKDCRVRLVYEDDASQFYNTVAPHGLHSKYYEHPSYHSELTCCMYSSVSEKWKVDSDDEWYIDGETDSNEETDRDEL